MAAYLRKRWPLYAMLAPAMALTFIFAYIPMGGLVMAFQAYKPTLGIFRSEWVGLEHFRFMFTYPDSRQVIWNTFVIAVAKLTANLVVSIGFALLLNELRLSMLKRWIQTLVYLPHFLSWVILGGIMIDMLSPTGGLVNRLLETLFGLKPIFFLGDGDWFRATAVVSEVWKEFGFSTIVFLAALAGVNPALYEASEVDGASRLRQTWHITFPAIVPIVIVVGTLSLGNVLNAGFDQIFNLYNAMVYDKGDIIDTFVYRVGIISGKTSFSTAIGMFKSVIGFVLIVIAYRLAYRYGNYRIF